MAQAANMSTEAFENFYFDVCTMDYDRMARAMEPLEARMKAADEVVIKGPDTDLAFSIKGIGAKSCNGKLNIPDGEVFSCPVKNSVNGVIHFNTPTLYSGTRFENVRLEFKDGKVVEASSSNPKRLNEILDTDAGRGMSGNSRSASTRTSRTQCATSYSTKRSRDRSISPRDRLTKSRTTGTARRCTGTWC